MTNISFNSINPFIRFSRKFYCTANTIYSAPIVAYDYRLFYCIDGSGFMVIDSKKYDITPGCLMIIPPNTPYLYFSDLEKSMVFYVWNFDFTHDFSNLTTPIPPDYAETFNNKNVLESIHFTDAPTFNSIVYLKNIPELKTHLSNINKEFSLRSIFFDLHCSSLATTVLVLIYKATLSSTTNNLQKNVATRIIEYINKNYTQNINNSDIGKIFGYNPNYINSLFVKYTGVSLHQYVLNTRINQAIRLIMDTSLPFHEISTIIGFKDYSQFLRCFKKITNVTPKYLRK